jgi:hypothetical protein
MRYVTATEMLADLAGCALFRILGGWVIVELYVTMPGRERVWFPEGHEANATLIRNAQIAYFRLNAELEAAGDTSASQLTYATVSRDFRFHQGNWVRRRRPWERLITRIARVSERNGEAQALHPAHPQARASELRRPSALPRRPTGRR